MPASEAAAAAVPAIRFDAVTARFPARPGGRPYTAVADVSLTIGDGEFVSVVGPTGCGKSTLLNMAAGLLVPASGAVASYGAPVQGINRRAGYVFQGDALLPWRNALRNVMAGLEFDGAPDAEPRARDWLRRVGLGGFEARYPHEMSGGMRKRVALAQTFVLDPDILLMDEPFSALDIQTRQLMENELLDLWAQKRKAVIFVTHDLDEAIALSDRVVILSSGPGTRLIGSFDVDLDRPRDVMEIRQDPRFTRLHAEIWALLKEEVVNAYQRQMRH